MKTVHTIRTQRKPSRRQAVVAALHVDGVRKTREQIIAENHAQLSIDRHEPELDSDNEFFARPPELASIVSDDARSALDSMLEAHGIRNVLLALAELCESRVECGTYHGKTLILHLSREDAYARMAERIQSLGFSQDARDCDAREDVL